MKTMGKIITVALILFGLSIMGVAKTPEISKINLIENGLSVVPGRDVVSVGMKIERATKWPVAGVVKLKLFDIEGKRLARLSKEVYLLKSTSNIRLDMSVKKFDPGSPENYIIECGFQSKAGGFKKKSLLYNLVPIIETRVLGPSEMIAGSDTSLRVIVRDKNTGAAIQGARVSISINGKNVYSGKTNPRGTLSPEFGVPAEPGTAQLVVDVESEIGADTYKSDITIKEVNRILLVTDKPLYQPGQDIHLRALALSMPYLKPLENRRLTFEVEDSKGNKVFKRTASTDRFGISAAIFTLASEVNMGEYKVRVLLDDSRVEKTVTVDRYVLPKFKIAFESDRMFYKPGQNAKGRIDANYFFGKPVSRGKVSVTASKFDVGFHPFATVEGKTDAEGHYNFELKLPDYFVGEPLEQGKARVLLELSVTDGAGHEETSSQWLTVSKTPILVDAIPESGSLVRGVANDIFIIASSPGGEPLSVEYFDPYSGDWIPTDETGIGVLSATPKEDRLNLNLKVRGKNGDTVSKKISLKASGGKDSILARTDHGIYRAGDTAHVTILSQRNGTAYVDLIREGQTVHTAWTEIVSGRGDIDLPIPMDAKGSGIVHAYRLGSDGNWLRDSRRILIEPANDLTIEIRPDKKSYLPAEEATIDFFVKDDKGRPASAAIGFQIVDESVFALQEMRPGLERVYFLLEKELSKPRYEIHGFSMPGIVSEADEDRIRKDRIGKLLLSATDAELKYDIVSNSAESKDDKYKKAMWEYLKTVAEKIIEAGDKLNNTGKRNRIKYPDDIGEMIKNDFIKRNDLGDPWGNEIKVEGYHPYPHLISAGPDGEFGTSDDIDYTFSPPAMPFDLIMAMENGNGGPRGGALKMAPRRANGGHGGRNGKKYKNGSTPASTEQESGGEEPRIRSYFPETLWVEPSLITDGNGFASKIVTVADSITTWRITAMANSADGDLGSAMRGMRVFQEFFVDINLPVALTRNDRVTIPVAIYNYLPEDQSVRIELESGDWFDIHGDRKKTVVLAKNEVKGVGFDITVRKVGVHSFTVKAYGKSRGDAVRRSIEVIPDGQEYVSNFNGRLDGAISHELSFPGKAIPGANKLFVKVYPGLLAQVVEGLDNIFRMPSGCFEQTSSVTYPNILVLDYMQKAGSITPELKMKAEGFINNGYQRLLTFEVPGGGFEWFGNSPAHVILTAYGLMEFNDMSEVYAVDPAIIERTRQWLVRKQESNGSWKPVSRYLDQVASRFTSDVLRNTAYVTWSLAESGYSGSAVKKAVGYLKENRADAKDTYTKALIAIALASVDPKDPVVKKAISEIIETGIVKDGTIAFPAGADTAVHSSGKSADIETTALVGLTLLKTGTHREVVEKIINYLIETKDPHGTWYSTQATVFSLKLLVGSMDMSTEGGDAVVKVLVDGANRGHFSLKGEKADILQQIDLGEYATSGKHKVELVIEGEGNAFYSVVARHYIPWKMLGPERRQPMSLRVSYDRSELDVNDIVKVKAEARNMTPLTVNMIIIDLGIPPGFEVLTEDLNKYVENETIQRYNMTGRQIIVYVERLKPRKKLELTYRMKATMPMRAQSFASRLYEYYNPDRESFANPVELEVKSR